MSVVILAESECDIPGEIQSTHRSRLYGVSKFMRQGRTVWRHVGGRNDEVCSERHRIRPTVILVEDQTDDSDDAAQEVIRVIADFDLSCWATGDVVRAGSRGGEAGIRILIVGRRVQELVPLQAQPVALATIVVARRRRETSWVDKRYGVERTVVVAVQGCGHA